MISTIKQKLQLLLLLSIGGTMLLAGIAISMLITKNYEDDARQAFGDFFEQTDVSMRELKEEAEQRVAALAVHDRLIDSVSLISEYSDIYDYQHIIFDEEKKKLAELLYNFAGTAKSESVSIYDANGWLAAYVETGLNGNVKGIISFDSGVPIPLSAVVDDEDDWQANESRPDNHPLRLNSPVDATNSHFVETGDGLANEVQMPVFRILPGGMQRKVGAIIVRKYIKEEFITAITRHSIAKHAIVTSDDRIIGDDISLAGINHVQESIDFALRKKGEDVAWEDHHTHFSKIYSIPELNGRQFYIVSYLDKSVIKAQVASTQFAVLGVFAVSALLLFPMSMVFLRRSITAPIDNLVMNAQAIGKGKYDISVSDLGSDELDALAFALRESAETIREREQQLVTAHGYLEQRVEDRTADLSAANEKLHVEITERMKIEEKLRESQNMLQLVIDNIPQYVFWKDIDFRYLGCNTNVVKAAGLSSVDEIIGKTDFELPRSKEVAEHAYMTDQRVMKNDAPELRIHEVREIVDGKIIETESNKIPLHDPDGKVIGILGTIENIGERKEGERMLLLAKEQAEKANLAKSEFLSRMSHELRTPLNAILGFAQVLELNQGEGISDVDKSSIGEIITAGQHLLQLIVEILDLSKIESGNMTINTESIDFNALVEDCIRLSQADADARNIKIRFMPRDCDAIVVKADPVRLKQVLINLISNAIKYNRTGGGIILHCEKSGRSLLRVEVKDTGYGIAQERMNELFKPFERLGAENTNITGTGIGLLISKQLIEYMDGNIGVDSEEGKGTTVWFTIPVAAEGNGVIEPKALAFGENVEIDMGYIESKKVVYVEDNLANLRLMEKVLSRREGLTLLTAESALDGIELIWREKPDLILMDIQMPIMDGYEAFAKLQEDEETRMIPVVAVSANAMETDIKYARELGFKGYLTKPIDIQLLYVTIDEFLC